MADYTLGSLIWRIRGETADFDKKITASNKKIGAIADKTKAAGKKLSTFLTAPLVGAGIAATKAASDLEESINAVSVVFGDSADTINAWGKDAADNAGLSRSAFNELATTIGSQLKQSGLEIDEVADRTTELTQRSADLASVFNTDVKDATGALGAALRGESEPARRFGINISDAAVQAEALASGLVNSKDEITEQIKVQARYNLIMKQSEQVAGDFANTSDSLANQTRIVKSELVNVAAELGENLIPIATDMVEVAGDLVGWFGDLSDAEQRQVVALGGVAAAIGPVLIGISSLTKAYQVLATTVLFGPVGLIAGTVALGVALAATADEQDRATVSNSKVNKGYDSLRKLAHDARGETRKFATAQDVAADAAKIAGDRYQALADSLTAGEGAAKTSGDRYQALAESLGLASDNLNTLTDRQKEAEKAAKKAALAEQARLEGVIEARKTATEGYKEEIDLINRKAELELLTAEEVIEAKIQAEKDFQDQLLSIGYDGLESEAGQLDIGDEQLLESIERRKELYGDLAGFREQTEFRVAGFIEERRQREIQAAKDAAEAEKQALDDRLSSYQFYVNTVGGLVGDLFGSLNTISSNQNDKELQRLQAQVDATEEGTDARVAAQERLDDRKVEIAREEAKREKKLATFQAVIDTAAAIIGFLKDPGGFAGIALSVAAGITGAAQIAAIQSEPLPAFAQGGFVQPRPGTSDTGDRVPARLNPREVVLTEDDANELLSRIRSGNMGSTRVTVNLGSKTLYDDISKATSNGEIVVNPRSVRK